MAESDGSEECVCVCASTLFGISCELLRSLFCGLKPHVMLCCVAYVVFKETFIWD